jgi:hypothetical protein
MKNNDARVVQFPPSQPAGYSLYYSPQQEPPKQSQEMPGYFWAIFGILIATMLGLPWAYDAGQKNAQKHLQAKEQQIQSQQQLIEAARTALKCKEVK